MQPTKFAPTPFWLKIFIKNRWVGLAPYIYCPVPNPQDYPAIIAHEKVHVQQQINFGKWKWLFKYFTNKQFRFNQEVEGVIAEIAETPPQARIKVVTRYAAQLAGPEYFHAAPSYNTALATIYRAAGEAGIAY